MSGRSIASLNSFQFNVYRGMRQINSCMHGQSNNRDKNMVPTQSRKVKFPICNMNKNQSTSQGQISVVFSIFYIALFKFSNSLCFPCFFQTRRCFLEKNEASRKWTWCFVLEKWKVSLKASKAEALEVVEMAIGWWKIAKLH